MSKKVLLLSITAVLAIAVFGLGLFIVGHQIALRNLSFKTITPTQAAQAMKNDEFFSDYKENTLIIHGTVSSVTRRGNDTTIGFKTDSTYQTLCKLSNNPSEFKLGDSVVVEAIGGNAVREPAGVLLANCILP